VSITVDVDVAVAAPVIVAALVSRNEAVAVINAGVLVSRVLLFRDGRVLWRPSSWLHGGACSSRHGEL